MYGFRAVRAILKNLITGGGLKVKNIGVDNCIDKSRSFFHNSSIEIVGSNNVVKISDSYFCNVHIRIYGNRNSILVGASTRFVNGGKIWVEDSDGLLEIGAGCSFENVSLNLVESGFRISIGKDCMFSYGIELRNSDSHPIYCKSSGMRVNEASDIFIEDHVWVCANTLILKGTRIPSGSVVGAGSVVAKQFFDADAVYAGNPAKLIRNNISWARDR